jgi:diguanylate cyclase (GGDEF)-like protein
MAEGKEHRARTAEAAAPWVPITEPSDSFTVKMAALHDLSIELSLASGIDELCERAVRMGRIVLGFDRIGIWFVDRDDPLFLKGSFGVDESGRIRDERGIRLKRSDRALAADFREGQEPVYYLGLGPCFDDRLNRIGEAEKALALLWNGREVIGEVSVDNFISKRPIGGGELDLLVRYARMVGFLASFKLEQSELSRLSGTDELTGIVNRRTVLLFLEKQLGLALRNDKTLSVLYVDLDGLKAVNDSLGHAAGDEYIRSACEVLSKALRTTDTIGRLGGDEFLAVLPDCDDAGVEAIGRRTRALVDEWNAAAGRRYAMSLSMGFAMSRELAVGAKSPDPSVLIDLADARMFEDKSSRRSSRS